MKKVFLVSLVPIKIHLSSPVHNCKNDSRQSNIFMPFVLLQRQDLCKKGAWMCAYNQYGWCIIIDREKWGGGHDWFVKGRDRTPITSSHFNPSKTTVSHHWTKEAIVPFTLDTFTYLSRTLFLSHLEFSSFSGCFLFRMKTQSRTFLLLSVLCQIKGEVIEIYTLLLFLMVRHFISLL